MVFTFVFIPHKGPFTCMGDFCCDFRRDFLHLEDAKELIT